MINHFTAFAFWMRCIYLTNTMRAFWGVGSVLGAGVIAGSRTGRVASLCFFSWGQGKSPWEVPCGLRPKDQEPAVQRPRDSEC